MTTKNEAPVSRRGFEKHTENPFIHNGVVEHKTKRVTNRRGDMMMVERETGEVVTGVAGFWESETVDATKFVKLYVNGVKAFKGLSSAGTKVFEILYLEVQRNISKDVIWLGFNEVEQEITPISKSTFLRGMKELIEKGFIAESTTTSKYFLNPDYLWNGDRLTFMKTYVKENLNDIKKQQKEIDTKTLDLFLEEK